MTNEIFQEMRRKVLQEHKHSIIRSARSGHRTKGRGLVLVRFTKLGMIHLSYLTMDALKAQYAPSGSGVDSAGKRLLEQISTYSPESEIPVMCTDGKYERFSLGIRRP